VSLRRRLLNRPIFSWAIDLARRDSVEMKIADRDCLQK
jgi:hypothetical protein